MSQLSRKLRDTTDNGLMFWCPGCDEAHRIQHGAGNGPRWAWNGDAERPVFSPSVLVRGADFTAAGERAYEQWCAAGHPSPAPEFDRAPMVCHSFVGCNGAQPGQIIFLGDCTHGLAGKTVDLPDWPHRDGDG